MRAVSANSGPGSSKQECSEPPECASFVRKAESQAGGP